MGQLNELQIKAAQPRDKEYMLSDGDPPAFNRQLTDRNSQYDNLLKPAIRLIKCWNAANGYVFDSYMLEKWIVGNLYWTCSNLRDYVFEIFDDMSPRGGSVRNRERVSRAQQRVKTIRALEAASDFRRAEQEAARLIP